DGGLAGGNDEVLGQGLAGPDAEGRDGADDAGRVVPDGHIGQGHVARVGDLEAVGDLVALVGAGGPRLYHVDQGVEDVDGVVGGGADERREGVDAAGRGRVVDGGPGGDGEGLGQDLPAAPAQ